MSSDRPNQTLADYVALAISPALLMGLVGSLVFFLLEVLLSPARRVQGSPSVDSVLLRVRRRPGRPHLADAGHRRPGRAVRPGAGGPHLGRHADLRRLPQGRRRRPPFGPLINLFLVGVVWWCSHRLTRDCTQIDEEMEVDGEGLLQATGLEKKADRAAPAATKSRY